MSYLPARSKAIDRFVYVGLPDMYEYNDLVLCCSSQGSVRPLNYFVGSTTASLYARIHFHAWSASTTLAIDSKLAEHLRRCKELAEVSKLQQSTSELTLGFSSSNFVSLPYDPRHHLTMDNSMLSMCQPQQSSMCLFISHWLQICYKTATDTLPAYWRAGVCLLTY